MGRTASVFGMPAESVAEVICRDVLFAHWPIDPTKLRSVVPSALTVDTFDETAWVSIVVVDIAEARVQGVPYRPSLPSINLRTYVSLDGEPGVYFISLEMDGRLSAWVARNGFGLPYHNATVNTAEQGGTLSVRSYRERGAQPAAEFEATYEPATDATPVEADPETREAFLIERTNYYFEATEELRRTGRLLDTTEFDGRSPSPSPSPPAGSPAPMVAGAATHDPWPLLPVEAEITANTLFEAATVSTPAASPIFHYSRQQHMAAERLREVSSPVASSSRD